MGPKPLALMRMLQEIAMVRIRLLGGVGSPPRTDLCLANREKYREKASHYSANRRHASPLTHGPGWVF